MWTMLGSDRLAAPIAAHEPDLVLHGHAHAGRFEGAIGNVPVYNVSVPVMERDFWVFEVAGLQRSTAPVHYAHSAAERLAGPWTVELVGPTRRRGCRRRSAASRPADAACCGRRARR